MRPETGPSESVEAPGEKASRVADTAGFTFSAGPINIECVRPVPSLYPMRTSSSDSLQYLSYSGSCVVNVRDPKSARVTVQTLHKYFTPYSISCE